MKIAVTVAIETEPTAIDHIGVKQGLDWLGWDYLLVDPIRNRIDDVVKQIIDYKPDVILHYMDNMLRGRAPEKIADGCNAKQVFWEMDYRPLKSTLENSYDGQWGAWREQMQYMDRIFLSNKGQMADWEHFFRVPTSFLPHGCYVPKKLVFKKKLSHPCLFMGGMNSAPPFNERKQFIEKIMELVDITHITDSGREKRNQNWSDMPSLYYSSDTVLDISHFWDNPGYCSGRYFYTAGLGGCSITKRFPDCEKLYPQGTKLYFDTPEDAVSLITYYQKHKKEREAVKQRAYEYNKKHHNFKKRFEEIVRWL